jgi:Phycobilisome degradation protein nblA
MEQQQAVELMLEQEFKIRSFAEQAKFLSLEESRELTVDLYRQMMIRDALYRHFLAQDWGFAFAGLEESGESNSGN